MTRYEEIRFYTPKENYEVWVWNEGYRVYDMNWEIVAEGAGFMSHYEALQAVMEVTKDYEKEDE